ncbi:hypothetical protein GCM10012288_00230 [Malaciobacter pacificus]|uniref:Uncharacterized protein n=1 Tax=Malaciobacter pacificus TaxID=1080223 RepID=A0A5C2HAF5_9BACT|nr:hypothetical protein [Malaciobacter pacificus]QEP33282.1 hypothetical protein APAC_0112 [Malaciobacter pacificus]GGD30175.1 hypothetical protein GCM10012288_00230 [Malaciobacter pacificus]
MPQLIAMVIVVVGAMIYMFQTFGGTGDKIEGIAQRTSIITEINNIRNGLQLAVRAGDITNDGAGNVTTLRDLAVLGYFADQMNDEIADNTDNALLTNGNGNAYSAISFGGENNPGMIINLVVGAVDTRPGIRVEFLNELATNADFLETQIYNDLSAVASIDRTTTDGSSVAIDGNGDTPDGTRPVDNAATVGTVAAGTATLTDGIFTIYFKDMPERIANP